MNWIKSSFCDGGSCVEVAEAPTAERCDNGYCVEVAFDKEGNTYLRNSRRPADVLWFTPGEWTAFLKGATEAEFNFGLPIS